MTSDNGNPCGQDRPRIDWRNPETYRHLETLDRHGWAWEFLRRNPVYVAQAAKCQKVAEPAIPPMRCASASSPKAKMQRCHPPGDSTFAESPEHSAAGSLAFWRADCDPGVLAVATGRADTSHPGDFNLREFSCSALVFRDPCGIEHVMLHDGLYRLRFDVTVGSVLDGPCRLRYDLVGYSEVAAKLRTLQRLLALQRLGRFPRTLFPRDPRARRWMQVLQAFDARSAGATHREIAAALYGASMVKADWRGYSDYLRARVQRVLRLAQMRVYGGYLRLLR